MAKCKNCETEENGYGTILDKRGYCYKPSCQSCSYDEVEQQNTRLQSELDKQIKDNRKLVNALEKYANSGYWFASTEFDGDCVFLHPDSNGYEIAQQVLKEIDNKE